MYNIKYTVVNTLAIIQKHLYVCNVLRTNQDNQLLFNGGLSTKLTISGSNLQLPATDVDFYEWFRGLVDGEGCFIIQPKNDSYFFFKFEIFMHKDEAPMLKYIAKKLAIGNVYIGEEFSKFSVASQKDILTIIKIFDEYPLNTSKNLNYLL